MILRSTVPKRTKEHFAVDYSKSVDELYAQCYTELEEAYMAGFHFVDSL